MLGHKVLTLWALLTGRAGRTMLLLSFEGNIYILNTAHIVEVAVVSDSSSSIPFMKLRFAHGMHAMSTAMAADGAVVVRVYQSPHEGRADADASLSLAAKSILQA